MTTTDPFDRRLAIWLTQETEGRVADHLAEVLVATRATRQRPGWSSPGRWLPMDIPLRLHLVPAPRLAWLVLILALVIAVAVGAILAGMSPTADPFGPADNGVVVYGGPNGDIYRFDPATGSSAPLIVGPAHDVSPLFARDGSKFVFARASGTSKRELVLAQPDGSILRTLTEPFIPPPDIDWVSSMDWSPDGTRLALIDASPNTFSIVNVDGSANKVLDLGMRAQDVEWRPNGEELVFRGVPIGDSGDYGLYLVRADGTGLREISPPRSGDYYVEPALSPDGNHIVYTRWGLSDGGHLFVVDVETGETQMLEFEPSGFVDYFAEWSPDGRQLVFDRGRVQATYQLAVGSINGGTVVNIGPELGWAAGSIAAFSPDGSKVIARYSNGSTWIFDVAGGPGQRLENTTGDPLSWQRTVAN